MAKHGWNGLCEGLEILGQRPIVDIPAIEFVELPEVAVGSAMNLPVASHTGGNDFSFAEARWGGNNLGLDERPWSDKAHLAAKDVDQLREFIDRRLTEK